MKSLRIRAILRSSGFNNITKYGLYSNNNGYSTSVKIVKYLLKYDTEIIGEKEAKKFFHNYLEQARNNKKSS